MTFMEGFLGVLDAEPQGLHAVIAGDGPYLEIMREAAIARGAGSSVSFLGSIPHDQVIALQRRCDIYVSLNPIGNLSNSNLEAIKSGACMIVSPTRTHRGADVATDEFVADDAVLRIASPDDSEGLTATLLHLHRNPESRRTLADTAAMVGRRSIPSWRDRIGSELTILEDIAATGSSPDLTSRHRSATTSEY